MQDKSGISKLNNNELISIESYCEKPETKVVSAQMSKRKRQVNSYSQVGKRGYGGIVAAMV